MGLAPHAQSHASHPGARRRRRARNRIFLGLSVAASLFGLGWLALILGTLASQGIDGMSTTLFTLMTPPPGSNGGLANAILGSVLMSAIAVAVGWARAVAVATAMAWAVAVRLGVAVGDGVGVVPVVALCVWVEVGVTVAFFPLLAGISST